MADNFGDFTNAKPDALFNKKYIAENDANGNTLYFGYAKPNAATSDAAWLIKKITYDANDAVTNVDIANNNLSFSHVWDDRASLF